MSLSDCIGTVRSAFGAPEEGKKAISDEEIQRILQDVLDRHERRQAGGDPGDYGKSADDLAQEAQMAASVKKRNALINLQTRISRETRIEEKATALGTADKPDFIHAIQSELHGINTPVKGGRYSAQGDWKSLGRIYLGGVDQELERAGLFKVARGAEIEREWSRELFEMSKGPEGRPGLTGNKVALQIATILHRYQTLAKEDMNRAGAWVGDYAGYIARTSHDPDKMRRAGFGQWAASIAPKLDQARTFEGVDDPTKFLQGTYNALITGVHLTQDGLQGMKDPAFSGPANMAKKASQGRVLHFKDADSWLDYNKQFGTAPPLETLIGSLDRSARTTALMRRWGTNPRAEFDADFRRIEEKWRDKSPEAVVALQNKRQDLQNRFDFLDGTADRPVNRLGARVFSTLRVIESMGKLGNVALTHLTTAATKAAELRRNGVGLFEGYSSFLTDLVKGRGAAGSDRRGILDRLNAGIVGRQRELLDRFSPDDSLPGTVSKMGSVFMKFTALTYMLNAERMGHEYTLSRYLGSMLDREHGALDPATARELFKYNIGPAEWDTLRNAPDHPTVDGRAYLTPDAAERAGDKGDLGLRLAGYFNDSSERAVVTPGIAEKAILMGESRPGSFFGEFRRSIAQFKMWPTAVIRQQIGAELYGGQSKTQAFQGLLALAVGATTLGYMRMAVVDLANGKVPRAPDDPRTWLAAMAQGGGFGILGDYLFGEYSRFGHNFAESMLGPIVGGLGGDLMNIWNTIKSGKDPSAEAFHVALGHVPFVNLVYARLALNYAFLWRIQEFMSPGYLRRMESSTKTRTGQTFWLRPSQAVQR